MNLFSSLFLFIFQLLQKLRELQHEVLLLSHLKHPCIISLVGFILRPLCLVLELAPMRSLRLVINSHMNKHNKQEVLFPKMLTYRILLQVTSASKILCQIYICVQLQGCQAIYLVCNFEKSHHSQRYLDNAIHSFVLFMFLQCFG